MGSGDIWFKIRRCGLGVLHEFLKFGKIVSFSKQWKLMQ